MKPHPSTFASAFSLAGQRALVTGGSGGLGRGIAACLLAAGADVVISGTREDRLRAVADTLGPGVRCIAHDVTRTGDAEAFAAQVAGAFGEISLLVNNAGITVKRPVAEMSVEDFDAVLRTHVSGAFALSRAFLPQLEARGGSIIFTASMASFLGMRHVVGYAAAKSAYVGLVRSLAVELASRGVRVNGVAPGWVDTPMFQKATRNDPARLQAIMARIPVGELAEPEDIGWAMVYLAAPAARQVTGHVLAVDGGALHALF